LFKGRVLAKVEKAKAEKKYRGDLFEEFPWGGASKREKEKEKV